MSFSSLRLAPGFIHPSIHSLTHTLIHPPKYSSFHLFISQPIFPYLPSGFTHSSILLSITYPTTLPFTYPIILPYNFSTVFPYAFFFHISSQIHIHLSSIHPSTYLFITVSILQRGVLSLKNHICIIISCLPLHTVQYSKSKAVFIVDVDY